MNMHAYYRYMHVHSHGLHCTQWFIYRILANTCCVLVEGIISWGVVEIFLSSCFIILLCKASLHDFGMDSHYSSLFFIVVDLLRLSL